MTAGSPLGQLADLLRRVEAKSRAQDLIEEVQAASRRLQEAEEGIRQIEMRSRQVRPARQRELELVENEEQLLHELTRRTAQNRALMETDEFEEAQKLIENTKAEIERRKAEALEELEEIQNSLEDARVEVRSALGRYQELRRELDRLQLQPDGELEEADRLVHVAETYFPEYQVRAFAREVEDGAAMFGMLDRREQYAQMKIWIGRLRRFQNSNPGEDERDILEGVFRRLVSLSKQHEPGYIEAFNRQFSADWDTYIAEAQEALRQASEEARRGREAQGRQVEEDRAEAEQRAASRKLAEQALDQLKAIVLTHYNEAEHKAEAFRETLLQVVEGYGQPDEELLDVVRPYRDWLTGPEFRGLRRYLDQELEEEHRKREIAETREQYQDLIEFTKGTHALMIGGSVREEARRLLQRTFEFAELEWVGYQDKKPALLDSVVERIQNEQYDMVILLINFIGHHVSNTIRPLCKQMDIPCAMVEHGYGAVQVADALRRVQSSMDAAADDDDDLEDDED